MKKVLNIIIFICFASIFFCCKKDKNDKVITTSFSGSVYNLCNDSLLPNILVNLICESPNGNTKYSSTSDNNGNFIFNSIPVNQNDKYKYSIYIKGKSGIGDVAFTGDDILIDKNNILQNYKLEVIPAFDTLTFRISPSVYISSPDTFFIIGEQKTLMKNSSVFSSTIEVSSKYLQAGYPHYSSVTIGDFPMGKWNFTINKYKNGVYSVIKDSIYIGYEKGNTFFVPW
ncbi:MAG: hypothetical protein IPH32_17260 [Bacteroidetes bacterium]|nr:hypothetical protein [Bacteroidota bacterium]